MFAALRAATGWLLLSLVACLTSSCTPIVFSSPEGTITTYVKDSGVQVYAPRAARAQKVVFDTSDQQLIQKPETPFRKFFDAHSVDFASGKVEYAKTTILGDIVNLVRNKEFIRDMIKEVVDARIDTAIAPSAKLIGQLQHAQVAIDKLELEKGTNLFHSKAEILLQLAHKTAAEVIEVSESLCWSLYDHQQPKFPTNCAADVISGKVKVTLNLEGLAGALATLATSSQATPKEIRDQVTRLADALRTILISGPIASGQFPAQFPPRQFGDEQELKKLREHNATVLINVLFSRFKQADYPAMRPEEIRDQVDDFVVYDPIWAQSTVQLISPGEDEYKRLPPAEELRRDLIEVLIEQRYFRTVIDKAVEKRQDLFRVSGSPIEGVRQAQGTLTRFVKENIGLRLIPALQNGRTSLWNAFLELENGTTTEPGPFVTPETGAPLTQAQLRSFGEQLRQRLIKAVLSNQNLETSMSEAFGSFEFYLRPGNPGDTKEQIDHSTGKTRELWSKALHNVEALSKAFEELKEKAKLLGAAKTTKFQRNNEIEQEKQKLSQAANQAKEVLITLAKQSDELKAVTLTLQGVKKNLANKSKVPIKDEEDLTIYTPIERADALYSVRKVQEVCGTANLPSCPHKTGETNTLMDDVTDRSNYLLNNGLKGLEEDIQLATDLAKAVEAFPEKPAESLKTIQKATLKVKSEDLSASAKKLDEALNKLADPWVKYFSNNKNPNVTNKPEARMAQRLANSLKLSDTTGQYQQSTIGANQLYPKVKDELGKILTDEKMRGVQEAARGVDNAKIAYDKAAKDYDEVFKGYEQAESNTVPGAPAFLPVLKKAVEAINPKMEQGNRIHSDQVVGQTKEGLKPWREGSGIGKIESLESLLNETLKAAVRPSVAASRDLIAKDFAAIFAGQSQLIQSDEPILQAFINVGGIRFDSSEQKLTAAREIPRVFQVLQREFGQAASDKNNSGKPAMSLEQALTLLEKTVERPEVSYLFGAGATNMAVIDAFKKELYNAFRHRVPEAVAAEQEADYAYWWLTFYPKAIPLGDNALEGQSTIEIGFQSSVTPEEQYHRWIQDHIPADAKGNESIQQPAIEGSRLQTQATISGVKENQLDLQLATSVLNDFMVVLDSSDLIQKHQGMREILLEALERFVDGQTIRAGSYSTSALTLPNSLNRGVCYLYKKTLNAIWESTHYGPNFISKSPRPFILYLLTLSQSYQCPTNDSIETELVNKLHKYSATPSSTNDPKNNALKPYEALISSVQKVHAPTEENSGKYQANKRQDSDKPRNDILQDIRSELRPLVENDLAWDEFGPQHVLFAITSAIETRTALPRKVDVYAHAFFNGVRRFALENDLTKNEKEVTRQSFLTSGSQPIRQKTFIDDFLDLNGLTIEIVKPKGEKTADPKADDNLGDFERAPGTVSKWLRNHVRTYCTVIDDEKQIKQLTEDANQISRKYQPPAAYYNQDFLGLTEVADGDSIKKSIENCVRSIFQDMEREQTITSDIIFSKLTAPILSIIATPTRNGESLSQQQKANQEEVLRKVRHAQSLLIEAQRELTLMKNRPQSNGTGLTNSFIQYPHLWTWERRLQQMRERLRFSIVSLFETAYPDVPNPERIKSEFSKDDSIMQVLVYEWLRNLWATAKEQGIFDRVSKTSCDKKPDGTLSKGKGFQSDCGYKSLRVLLTLLLDRHEYITPPSRAHLISQIAPDCESKSDPTPSCSINGSIYDWIATVLGNQKLTDELQANLLETLYRPLWQSLGKLEKIERHPVPFMALSHDHYRSFLHWAKPRVQQGIQIMEILPASRDDLVSMSINEGGAVANLAAQAEGSAAYDINYIRAAAKLADDAQKTIAKALDKNTVAKTDHSSSTEVRDFKSERIAEAENLRESLSFKEAAESFGYGAGASAKGSVFARAKSMLAYSKRREYLDAAITASGRGDNFAKWVVRPSDFRSDLAGFGSGKFVAAAHNGFPNGDQPFHMMVKIPFKSVQSDWDGGQYISFNSTYTATKRLNWFKTIGFSAWLAKGLFSIANPTWWTTFEESIVGTTYPFKWDVTNVKEQEDLLKTANILGGRVNLDDTDKIRFSDVQSLLEAEASFIKATRSAQSKELSTIMGSVEEQAKGFRKEVHDELKQKQQDQRDLRKSKKEQTTPKSTDSDGSVPEKQNESDKAISH